MYSHSDFKSFTNKLFRYNSEGKSTKFPNPKMKLLIRVFLCKSYNKMSRGYRKNDKFLKILLQIYLEVFTCSFQSFPKCFSYLTA